MTKYTSWGGIESQTDNFGNTTRYTYDPSGQSTGTTDPDGNTTSYSYDKQAELDAFKLPTYGNVTMISTPDSKTLMRYNAAGSVTEITSEAFPIGANIIWPNSNDYPNTQEGYLAYTAALNLAYTQYSSIYAAYMSGYGYDGTKTKMTYNGQGDLLTVASPDNQVRTIAHDTNGNNSGTSYVWVDPTNSATTVTLTTGSTLDANDKPVASAGTVGGVAQPSTSTEFDAFGRAWRTTDANGLKSESTFDKRGLVIQTRTETINTGLNAATSQVERIWNVSRTVYDSNGRAVVTASGISQFASGQTITPVSDITGSQSIYNPAGQMTDSKQLRGVDVQISGTVGNLSSALTNTPTVVSTSTTTYDANGRTTQSIDSFGKLSQTQYDNRGNVVESRSQTIDQSGVPLWMVTRTVFDSRGRTVLSTDPYTVPVGTAQGTLNSPSVYASKTEYDSRGRTLRSVRLTDVVVGIDATSKQTNIVTGGSEVSSTRTEYDAKGRAYKQIGSDGQISITEFDTRSRAVASLGMHVLATSVGLAARGVNDYVRMRSETIYNSLGQATKSVSNVIEYGTVTNGVFTKSSLLVDTDRTNQRITEQVYDAKGQVVKSIAPDGTFTLREYDNFGRVKAEIDQLTNRKDFTYDTSGRLTKVELPAVQNPLNNNVLTRPTYQYEYNSNGQMTKLTDAYNNISNFGFNNLFQSTSRTLPSSLSETFEYDNRGRQTLQVTFEGIRKRTVYDDTSTGGGRVLRYELFANQANYDAFKTAGNTFNGNLATGVKWERVTMLYDAFGRLITTSHIYADGATAGNLIPGQFSSDIWTSSYDIQGRLTQETSPTGVIGYEYDPLNRKTRIWAGGVGSTATTALSDITYTYDFLGRLATVNTVKRDGATTPTESAIYHYDLLGRMDYTEMPNAVVEDFTFDNMDRLDVMRHFQSDANNANLADNVLKDMFDYSYRADGKRTGLVETFKDSGIGVPPVGQNYLSNNYTWTYDNAGRLASEATLSSDSTLDQTESYMMDLVGNRIRRTVDKPGTANDVTDLYTFDSNDRLQTENRYSGLFATGNPTASSLQSTAYQWSGTQQTAKEVSAPATSTVTQFMKYGLMGQLEGVITETKNGATVTARTQVEYRYDNSGLRFLAIDSTDSNLTTLGIERIENGRTEYLLDHMNFTGYGQTIIETVKNEFGQATKRTSFTIGTDEITQTVSTLNPTTGAVTATETLTFGHDGHGSTRALFGALAANVQVYTYSAYGEFLAIHNGSGVRDITNGGTASTLANPAGAKTSLLYNGESIDKSTGLYNFRARWYSASSGRFERLDPFAGNPNDPFSFHKYGFVHGNPVLGVDPSGNEFSIGGMMVSMGVGMGNFAQELAMGGVIIATLESGGRAAFDARAAGLMLIAGGDFERGFELYNLGSRIAALAFDTIDQIDSIAGMASLGVAASMGGLKLLRNAPEIAQNLSNFTRMNFNRVRDAAIKSGEFLSSTVLRSWDDMQKFVVQGVDHMSAWTRFKANLKTGWSQIKLMKNGGQFKVATDSISSLRSLVADLTTATKREVGLFVLNDGTTVIRLGDSMNSVSLTNVSQVIAHSHPSGHLILSSGDIGALARRGQTETFLVGPAGDLVKWTSDTGEWATDLIGQMIQRAN